MYTYVLTAIENTKERFLYFKVFHGNNAVFNIKNELKKGSLLSESYFLQKDYTDNPENFRIFEIEKTHELKEIYNLKEKYMKEFSEDLYPKSLNYKFRKNLDPIPAAVEIEPEKIIDSYNYSEELSLIGIGDV